MTGPQSAVIVPIRLPPGLARLHRAETSSAAAGVPPHVTILFPFVPPGEIDSDVQARLQHGVATIRAFDAVFREVRSFEPSASAPEGVVWLAPEPVEAFLALIDQVGRAFPQHRPYGGLHDDVIPHLTLADRDAGRAGSIAAAAMPALPINRRIDHAALISQAADGRWWTRRRLRLGA